MEGEEVLAWARGLAGERLLESAETISGETIAGGSSSTVSSSIVSRMRDESDGRRRLGGLLAKSSSEIGQSSG